MKLINESALLVRLCPAVSGCVIMGGQYEFLMDKVCDEIN